MVSQTNPLLNEKYIFKSLLTFSCPLPQAVCCDDHQHCCPNGYTCDTKDGRCLKGEISVPFFPKTKAIVQN
jgi:hypothetical protein